MVCLWHLPILTYLLHFTDKISRTDVRWIELGTRESPRFVEICLPFLGYYCLHCFAPHTRLRNFEFPCRKARERRSLITKSKYFTRVVTVSVVIRRIIIQTQTQKIPLRRFLSSAHLALRISKLANSNGYVVLHETRIKNKGVHVV